jgi:hypothetical protein
MKLESCPKGKMQTEIFKRIAEQINSNEKVNPHEYEEELEQRC